MRNATKSEAEDVRYYGRVTPNVIYRLELDQGTFLAHYVPAVDEKATQMFFETIDGKVVCCHVNCVHEPIRKQGTPKKVKKPHVKGSKPELGYDPSKIKVGVKVRCRDGVIREVQGLSSGAFGTVIDFTDGRCVRLSHGKAHLHTLKRPADIKQVFVEPVKETPVKETPEYEVGKWYRYDGNGMPVPKDTLVSVFLVDEVEASYGDARYYAWFWNWDIENNGDDILAFKVVKY